MCIRDREIDDEYSHSIKEAQNMIREKQIIMRENNGEKSKISRLISNRRSERRDREHSLKISNIEIGKAENIYKELKKEYKKLEIKNNPQKRKEMEESMSSNISEKKIRRSDSI